MVVTQKAVLDDVLDWMVHPGYCVEEVSLNNGDIALSAGDSLIGMIAINTSGTTWKILDDGDTFSAASIVGVILHNTKLLANAAADAAAMVPKCAVLKRGPARVHRDGLVYDAGLTAATVDAALAAAGIQIIEETGVLYSYDSP